MGSCLFEEVPWASNSSRELSGNELTLRTNEDIFTSDMYVVNIHTAYILESTSDMYHAVVCKCTETTLTIASGSIVWTFNGAHGIKIIPGSEVWIHLKTVY